MHAFPSPCLTLLSLLILSLAVLLYPTGPTSVLSSVSSLVQLRTCPHSLSESVSPHSPSWGTWFHPQRLRQQPGQSTTKQRPGWNLLYHLGGNGPWVQRADPALTTSAAAEIAPPDGCTVDQVHLMSRHAERYPTRSAGGRHLALLTRIKATNTTVNGSLSFLNDWTYFTDDPSRDFEQLTTTGPYAGTLEAFTTGVRFRTRYAHLLPKGAKTRFWASDSARVIDTARYFASGLFGLDWETKGKAELEIIPETLERHTDTLTPGDTCLRYIEDTAKGHDYGVNMLTLFQDVYLPAIAHRLVHEQGNHAIGNFSNVEVYSMQEMCGFETIARGSSPWCDVFIVEDWEHFEYARDLIHYYRAGPGNPYAGAMGWLWLNATANLLQRGPEAGTMFFSFVHDGDIAPMLTALNIFPDPKYDPHLPVTHIATDRVWRMSTVLPMGGRLSFERLTCGKWPETEPSSQTSNFVRININDGVVPLPDCHSGPGGSCPLEQFVERVRKRREEVGDFAEVCGTTGDRAQGITFLRQDDLG
ncbi:hypothetical protein VTN96DRAFT_5259 [Rasamsonia emersonii]